MYRKFKADQLFTGYSIVGAEHVLITNPEGLVIDIIEEKDAGEDIEVFEGLLSPGFINCHCHLELSHLKGFIPKGTGLVDFVFKIVSERHFEEGQILSAIEQAEHEMLQNGIVAVGDICNNTLTIPQKIKARLYYHNFLEASGFPPQVALSRFNRVFEFYNAYAKLLPSNSIVPHAPYSVSPEMFRMIDSFPRNPVLTIHNQEIPDENLLFEKGEGDFLRMYEKMGIDIACFRPTGKSSLQSWLPYFTKEQSIILVHNLATSQEDIEFTRSQASAFNLQAYFCLCPNANLYISNTMPDANLFIRNDCNIVLGTDSLASNDQLSIVAEINSLQQHFPNLKMDMLLQWATSNGAKALGISDQYGSFEKGKKPGVVLLTGDQQQHAWKGRRLI